MDLPDYDVRLSWDVITVDKVVKDSIRVTVNEESADLEDSVDADHCLLLRAEHDSDKLTTPLELRLSLPTGSSHAVTGFTILCESRHVEVYDLNKEYARTVRSELVDRVDKDFVVYRSEVRMLKPLTGGCTIRFLSLRSPTEMWLYGAVFVLSPQEAPPTTAAGFAPIVARLQEKEGSAQLSDNAKRFAQLVCGSTATDGGVSIGGTNSTLPMSLLSMMTMLSGRPPPSASSSHPKPPSLAVAKVEPPPPTSIPDEPRPIATEEKCLQPELGLSHSIVRHLEDQLWAKIEARLDAQERRHNEKLDLIISLLQNQTCSHEVRTIQLPPTP